MSQDQSQLYYLLERIQQGDQQALGLFYDITVGRVFSIAMKITACHAFAEEVVNDVYLQVWRSASNYNAERATPLAWLAMLAHSRAVDSQRSEFKTTQHHTPLLDEVEIEDKVMPQPLSMTVSAEQGSQLHEALKLLDKEQRQMIALAFYRGMSHQEIADYTGEPLGTVKTVLRRAQSILRAALAANDWREGGDCGHA